ncbi:MAG: HdeD family acid-resistance protein [Candidatus Eremiobacteraeota bacterium]|nr:HdeD family acid-resistance protein [Candidatus Eremiobacteraeota bacterium]
MLARLTAHWWLLLIRGILALALGIVMPLYPGQAIVAVALVFGAYALVDGIVAIAAAVRMNHADHNWGWLLVSGILGVIVGLITFFYPGITILWLALLFGAWAVVTGVLEIATAVRLRAVIQNEWLWVLFGVLSVIAGIVVFFEPAVGILAIVWTISVYAILAGIAMIGVAVRLRGVARHIPGAAG